jgi:transposase
MIAAGPATRVFVALEPLDMRKGYDGLYGLVAHRLGEDPRSGQVHRKLRG